MLDDPALGHGHRPLPARRRSRHGATRLRARLDRRTRAVRGRARRSASGCRLGDARCRVLGVLAEQGLAGGFNVDETVIMPVASAQQIFNTSAVFRILVEANDRDAVTAARRDIIEIVKLRHAGEEDITVVTQDALVSTFDTHLQHDHGGPRGDRRDQPRRGGRADHERHARRREPANGRDRPAEGRRRAQPTDPRAVPDGSRVPLAARRLRRDRFRRRRRFGS